MANIRGGPTWTGYDRDKEGNRTYKLEFIVAHLVTEGPAVVQNCPGLPVPGSFWQFGTEIDSFAFCYWANTVKPMTQDETNVLSKIEFTFSTKPENKFCRTVEVEDPITEPPKISGSFTKYVEEATRDRFGFPIVNSSWEQVRGTNNEWDRNRLSVKIEQNVGSPLLGYILPSKMIDTLNDATLWGFPPRTIKLSAAPWEAKFWGSCAVYYTRTLEFDIRYTLLDDGSIETWDRALLDEGTKVLNGHWDTSTGVWVLDNIGGVPPDRNNPSHFCKVPDFKGNTLGKVPLNGRGMPAGVMTPGLNIYMSLSNSNNFPLTNSSRWSPVMGAIPGGDWHNDRFEAFGRVTNNYQRGELVNTNGALVATMNWIALFANHGDSPITAGNVAAGATNTSGNWLRLPDTLTNAGNWSNATTYSIGQYVTALVDTGAAGTFRVQKYPQSNFLLLGIPLSF